MTDKTSFMGGLRTGDAEDLVQAFTLPVTQDFAKARPATPEDLAITPERAAAHDALAAALNVRNADGFALNRE